MISRMALPREAQEDNKTNGLQEGLGESSLIDFQDISGELPKPDHSEPPPHSVESAVNGQPLAIDPLEALPLDERTIIRESDEAFTRVRQSWTDWQAVGEGLLVLRRLAMREVGASNPASKLYKNRFHELLEGRPYCSRNMSPTTRKALLTCVEAELAIEQWRENLDEDRRARLNHPVAVLRAYREHQKGHRAPGKSRQARHEVEIETVTQEAATAVSSRDNVIAQQTKRIEELEQTEAASANADFDRDVEAIVQYVVTRCETPQKIRDVIDRLATYLEGRAS
jgi:hypothetical protein